MSKRSAESELTKDQEPEEEYNEKNYVGEMPTADGEELAKRRIFKVKRKKPHVTSSADTSKPEASPVIPFSFGSTTTPTTDEGATTSEAPASGFTWGSSDASTTTTTSIPFSFGAPTTTTTDKPTEAAAAAASSGGFQFNGSSDFKFSFETPAADTTAKSDEGSTTTTTATTTTAEEEKKTTEQQKSPFAFSFGTSATGTPAFSFDFSQSSLNLEGGSAFTSFSQTEVPTWGSDSKPKEEDLGATEESEVVGDFVARDVKFSDEPVKTGEEEEQTLYQETGKLFEMIKSGEGEKSVIDWKERGIGVLKVNVQKDGSKARLIMRKENILSVILNSMVFPGMKCTKRGDKSALLNANVTDEKGESHISTFLIRFQKAESADKLMKVVNEEAAKLAINE